MPAFESPITTLCNHLPASNRCLQLCRERRYPYVRLDGSTTINKRQKLVNTFCDPNGEILELCWLMRHAVGDWNCA